METAAPPAGAQERHDHLLAFMATRPTRGEARARGISDAAFNAFHRRLDEDAFRMEWCDVGVERRLDAWTPVRPLFIVRLHLSNTNMSGSALYGMNRRMSRGSKA
jgi:hypothetical protein